MLAGFIASLLVRWALRALARPARRSCRWPPARSGGSRHRWPTSRSTSLALLTFLGVTYFVLDYIGVTFLAQRVAGDLLMAIACVRGVTALSKAYLAPENSRRRLVNMDDFAAVEAERWVAVLLGLGLYGYFGLEAARRLGLPWTVHSFLNHLLFLVVAGLTIRAIYRLRAYLGVQHRAVGRAPGLEHGHRALPAVAGAGRQRPPRPGRLGGAGLSRLGGGRARRCHPADPRPAGDRSWP